MILFTRYTLYLYYLYYTYYYIILLIFIYLLLVHYSVSSDLNNWNTLCVVICLPLYTVAQKTVTPTTLYLQQIVTYLISTKKR